MTQEDSDTAVARIYPSTPRRIFGTGSLVAFGLLTFWLALTHPPALLTWQAVLFLFGAIALWGAVNAWIATARGLELTKEELRDTDGRVLCRVDDIRSVTSGALAFKPSNGFVIRLKSSHRMAWAPGLWWRLGRMVGVGGMTSGAEAKYMAEVLKAMVSERPS